MNQDELILEGKTYVSSKRAAQLTEYAQDYIGQLCRGGIADARRVNGLWYVTLASLEKHKTTSAEIKAQAFAHMANVEPTSQKTDTILSFSGEEYVSSRHGAEITGYNPDYITQLARAAKIRSRQVGSRWYVSKVDVVANKEKNDALLAAVQTSAVGLAIPIPEQTIVHNKKDEPAFEKRESESHLPLMPNISKPPEFSIPTAPVNTAESEPQLYKIVTPTSIHTPTGSIASIPDKKYASYGFSGVRPIASSQPLRTKKPHLGNIIASIFVVLAVVGGSFYGAKIVSGSSQESLVAMVAILDPRSTAGATWYGKALRELVAAVEPLVTTELHYVRGE
ncbi:helix-turn-helix domain-containing protein [Candidatus Kaiserbacteria bacterium]|nr:helix-turn-helix domain-containing protein [Candidatus Kaiserbacteria bacterium]